MSKNVQNDTAFAVATAAKRNALHWKNEVVTWGEIQEWVKNPASVKEAGNYVFGILNESTVRHRHNGKQCTGIHRGKQYVKSRSMLALDADTPEDGFLEKFELLWAYAGIIHTTYTSRSDEPRYRILIPLDKEVSAEEYVSIAETVMKELGWDSFDRTTWEPERYMFKPSAAYPNEYEYRVLGGEALPTSEYLEQFEQDLSHLIPPDIPRWKRDPLAIEGTVGAFNRAYAGEWDKLFQAYELPYESAGAGRWTYTRGTAVGGLSEVSEALVFSHHSTDPVGDKGAVSPFDMVRVHLYGDLDVTAKEGTPVNRLPSNTAMLETATEDPRVVEELVGKDFADDMEATAESITKSSWRLGLSLSPKTGKPTDTIHNWDMIVENDPVFASLYLNELTMAIETSIDLPWRKRGDRAIFDEKDRASLALYIEREYSIRPSRSYLEDLIDDSAGHIRRNPVLEYLSDLEWDGVPRLEEALPGVLPTEYTRMVARKVLTAAVARVFEPGCKWDHMLVLYGDQGIGKSHWIEKMAKGFSADLGRIDSKDTLITMQRSWILTSDEGHSLRKADSEAQKEFLTKTKDVFRMPYERDAQEHPRRCVIWGTTNDEIFLRRQEGNRRFLIVRSVEEVNFDELTDYYIDQVWAEAKYLYENGERLFLSREELALVEDTQKDHVDEDTLTGLIEEYVRTPVPADWDSMSPESRQMWLLNFSDGTFGDDQELFQIDRICSLQVWVEVLGRRKGDHTRMDLLQITEVLKELPGWRQVHGRRWHGTYGTQVVYERENKV